MSRQRGYFSMATLKSVNSEAIKSELKKVVGRVKQAQGQFEALIKNQDWVDEARKYADRQGKEIRKILGGDVAKLKTFLEKERKELEKFQKQIPGEVKKVRQFVVGQRKELEKLLANVKKVASQGAPGVVKAASKATRASSKPSKKKTASKTSASAATQAGESAPAAAPTAASGSSSGSSTTASGA